MTDRKLDQEQYENLKKICNNAGIKLTHQRLEIFKEATKTRDHPSAEIIYNRLRKKLPTIAIDTVYRTLATYDELGVVKTLHLMGERAVFDANLDKHHHFVCTRCKKIEDVYWPDFDSTKLPDEFKNLGLIQSRHLELHGLCPHCIQETAK